MGAGMAGRLLSEGFERQVARQMHKLLGHRFQPCHKGPGLLELVLSRVIFKVRCHVSGDRGERE